MKSRLLACLVLAGVWGCSSGESSPAQSKDDSGVGGVDSSVALDAGGGAFHDSGFDTSNDSAKGASDACVPTSCEQLGATCGEIPNGCGGKLECGTCKLPQSCGGSGMPHVCGCKPKSCIELGATCGTLPDGCSGEANCGVCPSGQTCGAKGANQCGLGSCLPKSCADLGRACGAANDGCGNPLDCGGCPNRTKMVCTTEGQCCKPKTCLELGFNCGLHDDGCGQKLSCGVCKSPLVCGANATGKCGCISNWEEQCLPVGEMCGEVIDDCGIAHPCPGNCPSGFLCDKCGDGMCAPKFMECKRRR